VVFQIDLIEQPFDREKKIKKGFCFITFESGDPVDVICVNQKHNLGGRDVRLASSASGSSLFFLSYLCHRLVVAFTQFDSFVRILNFNLYLVLFASVMILLLCKCRPWDKESWQS